MPRTPSRNGYTVAEQYAGDDGVQTTWAVLRDEDGTGLGAYASQDGVDEAIRQDRATAAQRREAKAQTDVRAPTKSVIAEPAQPEADGTRVDT